jgi:UDP-GlcNAc:undecaprenyl-phosphate/decaprenyl-phosphate GlcNAc-1-phosphate transferase
VLALPLGFLTGLASSWVAILIGRRLRLLDEPHGIKIHTAAVPFTGGLAYILALVLCAAFVPLPIAFMTGAILIWAVGFADDVWGFKPRTKLALLTLVLLPTIAAFDGDVMARLFAVLIGVVLVNVFNVLDGLDGLAGGVALFALLPTALVPGPTQDVAALTAGFAAAFLLLNVNPARIFLGDEGSLVLGYVMWFVSVVPVLQGPQPASVASATVLWAVPALNAAYVIGRRASEHRPILRGDRSHLYDTLHRRIGLRTTLVVIWTAAAITGLLAASIP